MNNFLFSYLSVCISDSYHVLKLILIDYFAVDDLIISGFKSATVLLYVYCIRPEPDLSYHGMGARMPDIASL